jgi:hypothetical protein
MNTALNFFDRLMIAVTFAEAGVDPADCTLAKKPGTVAGKKAFRHGRLADATKARG